jgi:hypothetical protein
MHTRTHLPSPKLAVRFAAILLIAICGCITTTKAEAAHSGDHPVSLEGLARGHWPETYAGIWGDPSAQGTSDEQSATIFVGFTADATQRTAELDALADSAGLAHGELKPVEVVFPLVFLERLARRIGKHGTLARKGERRMPGTHGGRFDLNIDVRSNRIEVLLPRPSAKTRRTFARYGPAVVVVRGGLAIPYSSW